MQAHDLRRLGPNEEIDYASLKSALKDYANIKAKINALLKSGDLIRVKKGLYVYGPRIAQKPYRKETLANLIYGPSCISLQYALAFYGLIPERVETVTSVTPNRDKVFETPVGQFTYRYLNPEKYCVGVNQIVLDQTHSILIATPEKALADCVLFAKKSLELGNRQETKNFLFDDLRLDRKRFWKFNRKHLQEIRRVYKNSNWHQVVDFFEARRAKS